MRIRARLARRADDPELRRLLRELPVGTAPALAYEREPDFFAGAPAQTLSVFADGRLDGMVSRSLRRVFIQGRPGSVGSVRQLRVRPGGASLALLAAGAAGLQRLHADGRAPYYLVTLAGERARSTRLLQSGRLGLPQPMLRDRLQTLSFHVPRKARAGDELPAWPVRRAFLNERFRAFQFGPVFGAEPRDGRRWVAVRGPAGLQGLAAVLDERAQRQIRVQRLPSLWRALRPLYNACLPRLRRWPRLPAEGELLDSGSLVAFCADSPAAAARLLEAALHASAVMGLRALNLCLSEGHPLLPGLRALGPLVIESRLGLLHWPDGRRAIQRLDGRPASIDASEL